MADSRQSENSGVLCRVFFITVGVLILVGYLEWANDGKERDAALFWLQMFTGSSFPTLDGAVHDHPVRYAFGAVVSIMLSLGPLLGVLWLLIIVLTDRRQNMFTYNNVLQTRDAALKLALKKYARENGINKSAAALQQELDSLFKNAETDWSGDLDEVLGPEQAKKFRTELDQQR